MHTLEELQALLAYDPETGTFRWKVDRCWRAPAGAVAGSLDKSTRYWQITMKFEGKVKRYLAHRLAIWFMTGSLPQWQADHIDGDRINNRWSNLRDVPQVINLQNQRRVRRTNKLGVMGVQFHRQKGRYVARLTTDGRTQVLGYFKTADEAHGAYISAKRRLHPGCTI